MPNPLESIQAEAETGATPQPDGSLEPQGPTIGERVFELFKPCPEDPLASAGFISQLVNAGLSKRSGVPTEAIEVGENLAHCINHLFPGSASGLPPILNLAKSYMDYRREAAHLKQPQTATP